MDKETKRRVRITIMGILGLVLVILGTSFAAFNANLAGIQIQTMNTGCLKVDMTDTGSVSLSNAMPETDESGLSGDAYVYTITNSCTTDAYYTTTINVMDTSNTDNASKVKVALDGDSYLAPTIESDLPVSELLDDSVEGVSSTYKLDEGYLKVGESKTFELRTWIDYEVTSITGGLENKIIINSSADNDSAISYNKNTAGYYVLSNNTIITNSNYQNIAPSSTEASGVLEVQNNDGITYHFRGTPNNYLTFASNNFKILSTNTDGSINIVMDNAINTLSSLTEVYNSLNLSSYETYIKEDSTFCVEDGSDNNIYIAKTKVEKYNPTGECESNNTISKIGLLTVDDLMYAGIVSGKTNTSTFLNDSNEYKVNGLYDSTNYYTYKSGSFNKSSTNSYLKAVITLNSDTKLEGLGTEEEPFYVSGKYSSTDNSYKDDIAPIIDKVSVDARWSSSNKKIEISARDNSTGSGLAGFIVKTEEVTPTLTEDGWEAATSNKYTTVNSFDNGAYYVYAKDNAGNISEGRKIVIEKVDKEAPTCTIRINPNGTEAAYKTLSIITEDTNIDLDGYSWSHTTLTEDVVKVTANGTYTGYLTDLAGNVGSCTGVVTNITQANEPELDTQSMIPIYWGEEKCSTVSSSDMSITEYPSCYVNTTHILDQDFYNYCVQEATGQVDDPESFCTTSYYNNSNSVLTENIVTSYYNSGKKITDVTSASLEDICILRDICGTKEEVLADLDDTLLLMTMGQGANKSPIYSEEGVTTEGYSDDNTYTTIKKADSTNSSTEHKWYDYSNKMWANSVTVSSANRSTYLNADPGTEIDMDDILTMQVWIPRYKYTVWNYNADGTATSEPQEIEILWEDGTETTGEIECEDAISGTDGSASETCTLKSTNATCTDDTCNGKTYTHPAFTFGDEELTGFWIGKFEITGTISNITTKPDLSSLRGQQVGTFETNIMAMNDSGNIYGFNSSTDTHMAKNSEWGAVAYLSHSKYGTCTDETCREVYINNSSGRYTGRSGGNVAGSTPINETYTDQTSTTQYNTYGFYTYDGYLLDYGTNTKTTTKDLNKVASTTGNIYGVYDMSGGTWEYTMANMVSPDGETMMSGNSSSFNSGYTGIVYDSGSYTSYTGTYSYPDNKYIDKYSFSTSNTSRIISKLGDGVKEVYNTSYYGWYRDYSYFPSSSQPWFKRGGFDFSPYPEEGVFGSNGDYGHTGNPYSARLVLLAPLAK